VERVAVGLSRQVERMGMYGTCLLLLLLPLSWGVRLPRFPLGVEWASRHSVSGESCDY